MKSGIIFATFLLGTLFFGSAYGLMGKLEYSPSLHVLLNHALVEGELLAHYSVESRVWGGGRKYKTKEGTVLVKRVLRQAAGAGFASGDTITFSYPYGRPISDVEGLVYVGGHDGGPKDLDVGSRGLFSFFVNKKGNRPGRWFYRTDKNLPNVEAFIAKFEADSTSTIAEVKSQHPNLRLRLQLPK